MTFVQLARRAGTELEHTGAPTWKWSIVCRSYCPRLDPGSNSVMRNFYDDNKTPAYYPHLHLSLARSISLFLRLPLSSGIRKNAGDLHLEITFRLYVYVSGSPSEQLERRWKPFCEIPDWRLRILDIECISSCVRFVFYESLEESFRRHFFFKRTSLNVCFKTRKS